MIASVLIGLPLIAPTPTASSGDQAKAIEPGKLKSSATPTADWPTRSARFGGIEWVTRPSRDAIMGFAVPIEIGEVLVKDGQRVKKGEILIKGRDAETLAALEVQRVRADNKSEIEAAQAAVELAQIRYDAIMDAQKRNAASPSDIADRRISLASTKAQLANAQARSKEESARMDQLQRQLERLRLEAPFDGIVDAVAVEVGQAVDVQRPAIRVVSVDPMWIDVPTPTDLTLSMKLKEGSSAWVLLDLPGEPVVIASKVLTVSPIADASAGTRRVRVEVPNAQGLPPGTSARVRFEAPTSDWYKLETTEARR
jgi:multidrug efflux system membrane fusion protein